MDFIAYVTITYLNKLRFRYLESFFPKINPRNWHLIELNNSGLWTETVKAIESIKNK